MRLWIVAVLAVIFGLVGGLATARFFCMRVIHAHFASAVEALADKQEYSCTISLGALDRLEAGEMDRAKLLLAREVASYYRHPLGQAPAQRQKLLDHIEKSRARS